MEDDEEVGTAVIHAVGVFKDCSPTSLPPLQEAIDVTGLNKLFHPKSDSNPRVSFQYDDVFISIQNGHISVSSKDVEQVS